MPDFYTLYLVVLLLNLSHCIIWSLIVYRYRDLTAARYWLAGSAAGVAGGVALSLQGEAGLLVPTVAGNGFIILGFYLNWFGALHFHHNRTPWIGLLSLVGISVMLMLVSFQPWHGHNPLYTLAQALPLALTAAHLLRYHHREIGAVVTSTAMIAGCASHCIIASGNLLILTSLMPGLQLIHAAALDLAVFVFAAVVWNFGFLLSAVDRLRADVERLANEDDLTGLANRRMFMNQLSRLCDSAHNVEGFSLMLFDLDRFKPINDKYGHAAGDAALRHVATVIMSQLLQGEMLARLGGDEFGLLLPGQTSTEAALIATRITNALRTTPLQHEVIPLRLTVSIGIVSSGRGVPDPATLLERADRALYETKRRGRNGYTINAVAADTRDHVVQLFDFAASAGDTLA